MGTKEDESKTGRVWAAGYHHVTARSRLSRVFETYEPFISLVFQISFSGRGKTHITETADTGVRLYLDYFPESLLSNSQVVPHTAIRSLRPTSMPFPYHCVLIIGSYIIWTIVTLVK